MQSSIPTTQNRRDLPKVTPAIWAGAGILAAIIVLCAVSSLRWYNRPFPGFFLWENLFVPAIADTDWTGYEAHLPMPARVLSVEGQSVTSAAAVYARAESVPLGTPLLYGVERTDGIPVSVRVATMRLSIAEYLWTLGTYLGIGSLLCLLGLVVYILRPDAVAARAMLASGVVWGLYFVTAADIIGPGWFRPLCLTLQAFSPATLVHLALTFPVERSLLRRRPWILLLLYAGAVPFAIIGNILFVESFTGLWRFNQLHGVACGVGGSVLIGSLIHTLMFPPSVAIRQRTKIAALGGFISFLLPVAGIALFAFLGVQFPLNFLALPLALFPVAIGYAIVKHDLFEVDTIIRRTVSWAILSALIAIVYLGGVGTIEVLFTRNGGRVVQLLFLLVVVAIFNPLRDRVQHAVDFLFARDRYDYRGTVGQASQALASLLEVDAIVDRILRTITEAMHVELAAVWLRNGDGYELHGVAGSRQPSLPAKLRSDSVIIGRLERHPLEIVNQDTAGAAPEMSAMTSTLLVPMSFEHRLTGLVALGNKESGQFYSTEDVGLLRTLANQGAVAVQNARSYDALLEANENLKKAQDKLIEAERLAAIGELSAAVAHGIRNPLAGIKAAAQLARMDLPPGHALHESINDINDEANKLEARIKTLLDFSKPFEPQRVPCRISDLIESAVASLRGPMEAYHIVIETDIAAELPSMHLDAAQIEEVLLALLGNAMEAMTSGGRIRIRAHSTGSGVRIEVVDNGPGIPADRIDSVFKLFFTTKSSGTGFGLAVAKKVIERHGGTIRVESEVGQGARFMIDLPRSEA